MLSRTSFIIVLLLLSNLVLGYLLVTEKNHDDFSAYRNKYPLIDPARNLIEKQHFFSTIQPLRDELYALVESAKPAKIGLYFEYLNTGANISINQDERFWPASLTKLPTAFVVMKKIEKGEWKLDDQLVLFEEDKDDRYGELYKEVVGTRLTIEELLKQVLIASDNTAHRILVRNLGSDEYTEMLETLGLDQLFDQQYDITAKEYSRLLRVLYSSSYLDREHSQLLLQWLSETNFKDFLASGVPAGVAFAHKIGDEEKQNVYLDSGIAYLPSRPYLLTVMIKLPEGENKTKAQELMQRISQAAYAYVVNQ